MALTGKTVVVVGGSRGLGAEMVRQMAAKGNRVIASCRQPAQAQEIKGIENVAITQCDVSCPQSIEAWADQVATLTQHADYVINNAGVYGKRLKFGEFTAADMLHTFTTNCVGPLLVIQNLHKRGLLGGQQPTVVANVSSKVGSIADNSSGGGYAYRSSKAALNMVNKSLTVDLASKNIICTLLHPGYVMTDMTGGKGLIDKQTSVAGMLAVLEDGAAGKLELAGAFHDYKKEVIPW